MSVYDNTVHVEALRFVATATAKNGFPPTVRDIGRAVGYSSSSSAALIVNALLRKGWLQAVPHRTRTMRITDTGMKVIGHG